MVPWPAGVFAAGGALLESPFFIFGTRGCLEFKWKIITSKSWVSCWTHNRHTPLAMPLAVAPQPRDSAPRATVMSPLPMMPTHSHTSNAATLRD